MKRLAGKSIKHLLGITLAGFMLHGCATDSGGGHGFMHDHGAMQGNMQGHSRERNDDPVSASAIPLDKVSDLDGILPVLGEHRVVFVGETHDQLAHHLVQLEIIRHLHEADPQLAIGMEFFQRPFQRYLDQYVAGEIDEQEMLRKTEYYKRWRYDYRLYAPILRYAREHGLPLLALNAPAELVSKVRKHGIDGLEDEDRTWFPSEIDRSDKDHEARMGAILAQHPHGHGDVERFLEVQLLWDESMAEQAATFLGEFPDHRMVILAGSGHLAYGGGIPDRLKRRVPIDSAIVLNDWRSEIRPGLADYLLMPEQRSLPPAGLIGARLEVDENGLTIASCSPDSACEEAGLQTGDRLLEIDGNQLLDMADLRLLMWNKSPGDEVTLTIERERRFARVDERSHTIRLR